MQTKTKLKLIILLLLFLVAILPNNIQATTQGSLTYKMDATTQEISITGCDKNATNITIPSKINKYPVTKIGFEAFKDCTKLTKITIPSGVKEIANSAFSGCSSLTSISVPGTVTSIESDCFKDCISLQNVTLTKNVKSIASGAFSGCTSLSNFTIPNGVKTIGNGAFRGCSKLANIVVPSSVTDCSSAFTECTGLVSLTINGPILSVDSFAYCPNLKSIKLPNTLHYIEAYAFRDCTSLEEITIPASVYQVKLGAFANCTSLKKVTVLGPDTSFSGSYIFSNTPADMTLYVIRGSYAEALATNGDYKNDSFNYEYITIAMSKCNISEISNKTYTGKGITQKPLVRYGNVTLKSGTDYKLSYSKNVNTGKATVMITGIGNYTGTVSRTFYILPKKVSNLKAKTQTTTSITLNWYKTTGASGYQIQTYNSAKKKWINVATTTKTSYTVSKLGKGKTYKYKVRAYKTIDKAKKYGSWSSTLNTATKTSAPKITGITAGKKKVTIKWNKVTGASGYEIRMATSKKGNYSKIKTVTKSSTIKYTKTKLKKNKRYYFKVRAYKMVGGKKIYSSYSSIKSIKVK